MRRLLLVRRHRQWWVVRGAGRPDLGPYASLWEAGQVAAALDVVGSGQCSPSSL